MVERIYSPEQLPKENEKADLAAFLYNHLDQYGDSKKDILKAINYALSSEENKGGLIITSYFDSLLTGAVVVNFTGMDGYIPENILVYIATHKDYRGMGIGKKLMKAVIERTTGSIALHVEPDNPALQLYEKIGFVNKYLEMRLIKHP
ncbi:GNAT family N-acetyltransferase [uncultured Fluviicola sp.]|uniref:GNAT family N-acetyltransferase n=1 Tax=uncultured Fluviicola sp. TaxID=463303 RepID=UPI0025FA73F6|nr:GNAT family N-acetyltransferase [uncultured Fluviicola sp.]